MIASRGLVEIAAYRLRAKNILLFLRKYCASPEEKDVSGGEQGNHSHNSRACVRLSIKSCSSLVARKIKNIQMEVARKNNTLEDELLRMQQENQRREVDFDAEQAHRTKLNKHDSSSDGNRNNLLLKMNRRDSKSEQAQ